MPTNTRKYTHRPAALWLDFLCSPLYVMAPGKSVSNFIRQLSTLLSWERVFVCGSPKCPTTNFPGLLYLGNWKLSFDLGKIASTWVSLERAIVRLGNLKSKKIHNFELFYILLLINPICNELHYLWVETIHQYQRHFSANWIFTRCIIFYKEFVSECVDTLK